MPDKSELSSRQPRKRKLEESEEGEDQYCEVIDVSSAKRPRTLLQQGPGIFNFFKRVGEWFKRTSQTNTRLFGVSSESNSAEEAIAHGGQYLEEASNDKFMPRHTHNGNGNPMLRPQFPQQYSAGHSSSNNGSEHNPRPSLAQGVFVNGEGLCGEHPNSFPIRKELNPPSTNSVDRNRNDGSQQGGLVFDGAAGGFYDYAPSNNSGTKGNRKSGPKSAMQSSAVAGYNLSASSLDGSDCNEQINGSLQKSYVDRAVKHRTVKHRGASAAPAGLFPDSVYGTSYTDKSLYTSTFKNVGSVSRESFDLKEKERYKRLLQQFAVTDKTPSSFKRPFLSKRSTGASSSQSSTNLGIMSSVLALDKTAIFNVRTQSPSNSTVDYTTASLHNDITPSIPSHRIQTEFAPTKSYSIKPIQPVQQSALAIKCDNLVKRMQQVQERSLTRMAESKQLKAEEMKLAQWEKMRAKEDEHLERMVQQRLQLSAKVILKDLPPPEIEEYDEFPELSDDAELTVSKALQRGPNNVLSEAFRLKINRSDITTLAPHNWLNDEVVNFYFNLIQDRSGKDGMPSVYVFNTFFYPKIMKEGHKGVRRWTKQVDLFAKDVVLVPVHLGMHWCVAIINLRDRNIQYFDSMSGDNYACLGALKKYIEDESVDKKQTVLDTSDWMLECVKDIPQQMNGSDCGVFACKYAEYLSRDAPFSFSQENMPYFRRRMVYEILTKKLL